MKAELLAPAGSFEAMEAAINAGADAVYLGGEKYGARAYARNFDREELLAAIRACHLRRRRVYLTVNTLLKDPEMGRALYDYLLPLYEEGLDAVIVQDMGVLTFVKKYFPGLAIHASTQMTVTGVNGALLLKEAGVRRIVTARELSAREIRSIRDATQIEIESFVHGALCYCYSGQCLMSSLIGGRSGNRGRCAQPCRLPYEVWQNGRRLNDSCTMYPLSTRDMCTVGILPKILESGVYSLKIEGRMKKPEYAAGVVSVYRKYLDLYLAGGQYPKVSREDMEFLYCLYQRDGFHQSYYFKRNGRDMIALANEKERRSAAQTAKEQRLIAARTETILSADGREKINGILRLFSQNPSVLELSFHDKMIRKEGDMVQPAKSSPLDADRARRQIEKTGGTPFVFDSLRIECGEGVFLPMQQLNRLRRDALELLCESVLADAKDGRCAKPYEKDGDAPAKAGQEASPSPYLAVSVTSAAQWDAVVRLPGIRRIYADVTMFAGDNLVSDALAAVKCAHREGKECMLLLPAVERDGCPGLPDGTCRALSNQGLDGFLARSLEGFARLRRLGLAGRTALDANLYAFNRESQKCWRDLGARMDTIPLELNRQELLARDNSRSEMVIYGRQPMMVSAQCLRQTFGGCSKKGEIFTLRDRYQKDFPVVCNCKFCYNTIYNSVPLSLYGDMDRVKQLLPAGFRLSFTVEDAARTRDVSEAFLRLLETGDPKDGAYFEGKTTRGHFARGVL